MLTDASGTPVHVPANPARFEFDAEVAKIFPDMSRRAIPNFETAHALHAKLIKRLYGASGAAVQVLDIGASRGAFFDALVKANVPTAYTAVDNSSAMCQYLRNEITGWVLENDILSDVFDVWAREHKEQFDVVCCNYVLQFLPPQTQLSALHLIASLVRPGGLFILGQKTQHPPTDLGAALHDAYIDWRVGNGYSREEIAAKTQALKGSMAPMTDELVRHELSGLFQEVAQTTAFVMFNTLVARK